MLLTGLDSHELRHWEFSPLFYWIKIDLQMVFSRVLGVGFFHICDVANMATLGINLHHLRKERLFHLNFELGDSGCEEPCHALE